MKKDVNAPVMFVKAETGLVTRAIPVYTVKGSKPQRLNEPCLVPRAMTLLLSGVVGAALALNAVGAISNGVQTAESVVSQTNAPVEKEYEKLLADDEAAQAEAERWRHENNELAAKGIGM